MAFGRAFLSLALASCACAQTSGLFQWGFNFLGSSLQTCAPLSLFVSPTNPSVRGTPPYYMMAFPIGGTPRTYPIGSNEKQLSWTMDYDIGTKLILSVVDATGSAGGVDTQVYTSAPGATTCIKKDAASGFTVSANVTTPANIQTCDPWAVTASGGSPPYTFMLVAVNSSVVTNVTAVIKDQDELIYINRANPNTQLLAAVVDSAGKFAYGSPVVNTQGSTNIDCANRESTLINSKDSSQNPTQTPSPGGGGGDGDNNKKSTPIGAIVGGVIGGLLLLAVIVAGVLFLMRRRRHHDERDELDLMPDSTPHAEITPYTYNSPIDARTVGVGPRFPTLPPPPTPSSVRRSGTTTTSASSIETAGFAGIGLGGRSKRRISAGSRQTPFEKGQRVGSTFQTHEEADEEDFDDTEEVIVQHRDAGRVVRELPPPYLHSDSERVVGWPGESSSSVRLTDMKSPPT